jgi:hypothetical protein
MTNMQMEWGRNTEEKTKGEDVTYIRKQSKAIPVTGRRGSHIF